MFLVFSVFHFTVECYDSRNYSFNLGIGRKGREEKRKEKKTRGRVKGKTVDFGH